MSEIRDILFTISEEIKDLKARIELIRNTKYKDLKNTWIDNQDVMQMLHISQRTLQTLRSNGTIPFSKIQGKFYYKVADIEQLLLSNYYNPNFKCDGIK